MYVVKCVADANLQHHYVGDGNSDVVVAGLGIPPSALMDGSAPSTETLFKHSLHEVRVYWSLRLTLETLTLWKLQHHIRRQWFWMASMNLWQEGRSIHLQSHQQ
jgi:hypothetical protein